jgi:hypothetical protein
VNYEESDSQNEEEEKRECDSNLDRDNNQHAESDEGKEDSYIDEDKENSYIDIDEQQLLLEPNQRQLQELKRKHSAPEHISIRETKRKSGKHKKLTETEIRNEEAIAVACMKENNNLPNAAMVFGSALVTDDKTVW